MSSVRQSIIFATIYQIASAERRPATLRDLKERTGHYRNVLTAELRTLVRTGRIRKYTMSVSESNLRYYYVPADPRLANGVGTCDTEGCTNEPEVEVAGHALCRQCSRGHVSRTKGGGEYKDDRDELRSLLEQVAEGYDGSQASGGWEPSDGDKDLAKL